MRLEKMKLALIRILILVFVSIPFLGYLRILCSTNKIGGIELSWAYGAYGSYSDREGNIIVDHNPVTEAEEDLFQASGMSYLYGNIIGFNGVIQHSLEEHYDEDLSAQPFNPFKGLRGLDMQQVGKNLRTTLLPESSLMRLEAAFKRTDPTKLSLVAAYNYQTGEVLVALSLPSASMYDENAIPGSYLNTVLTGTLTTGSTTKILAIATALEQDPNLVNTFSYTCTGSNTLADGTSIVCPGAHWGPLSLADVIGVSCNCAIAELVKNFDMKETEAFIRGLGYTFNEKKGEYQTVSRIAKGTSVLRFKSKSSFDSVWSFIGQGSSEFNPLDLCMLAASIAGDGSVPTPYLVSEIRSRDRSQVYFSQREEELPQLSLMSEETAALVRSQWRKGFHTYYSNYDIHPLISYAKTGTVQSDNNNQSSRALLGVMEDCNVSFFIFAEGVGAGSSVCFDVANVLAEEIVKYVE